jgi:hypothetical protein
MKIIISVLFILLFAKSSWSQTKAQLIGTWELSYSLQADKKRCELSKDSTTLIFFKDGTYLWNDYGTITKGNWQLLNNKIRFFNIKAINFKGTLSDVSYEFKINSNHLFIRQPEGVEIPCPNQYFIRRK